MSAIQVKSHAKINLALNITGKLAKLHKIESIVSFINLHDLIFIKQIKEPNHRIYFYGNFSQKISKNNTFEIFDSKINNTEIRDYIFSPDTEIGVVTSFEKDDSIIILSLSEIIQPALQTYEDVQDEVSQSLTSMKTVTKQNLLLDEIAETKISGTVDSFISAYSFIKSDSFINVARGSSLLPQEVLSEAFKLLPGESTSTKSISGDDYIIDLISINKPS